MDKQDAIRQERNLAVKEIQEQVSHYVIENYAGIEKIEWHGWSAGPGPLSINTAMTLNDYPITDRNGFFSYSAGRAYAIEYYTDAMFEVSSYDGYVPNNMIITLLEQGVRKSSEGSPSATIIYNWEETK